MNISLTPELESQIRIKVDSGLYQSASVLVAESLQLLLKRDAMRPHLIAEVTLGADQLAAMHAKTAFDAKTPQLFFEPDALIKQQQATADARALCAELLDPLYKQLQ